MSNAPAISIMTVVYNGEKNLDECLASISAQTFPDFELVVVDDGSTDQTPMILKSWQQQDSRMRVLTNRKNQGRPFSRNRALTAARAPLVAVLDADDYSMPDRFARQYEFLSENPEVNVLGGDIVVHGTANVLTHPRTNAEIRADLFFDSSLFHSTVMMRKSILESTKSWYDPELPLAQDYGLWASLMFSPETVFANLPVPVSWYRLPEKSRPGYADRQFNFANVVRGRILQKAGLEATRHSLACHLALLYGNASALGVKPDECIAWGRKLSEANAASRLAGQASLEKQISERISRILTRDISERGGKEK